MKWNIWKKKMEGERQWFSVQLGNWQKVALDIENPSVIPDLERRLVEQHNALPAWNMWEQASDSTWYGVELVRPHSDPAEILQEMRNAGFEIRAFVLYGGATHGIFHRVLADEIIVERDNNG